MLEFPVWRNLAASRPRAAAGRGRGTHQPPRGGVDAGGVGAVGGAGEEVARTATHSSGRTETASESCKLAQKLQPDWEQMDGRERRKKEQEAEIDTKRRAMLAGTGRNTDSVRAPVPLHRPFPAKR